MSAILLSAGCGGDDTAGGAPVAVFALPRGLAGEAFFDLPWPTDLRRAPDGKIDVRAFPNPSNNATVAAYVRAISSHVEGFSTVGSVYLRFSAPVDLTSLPATAADSLAPGATVFLMDVDPDSPTRGRRRAMRVHYREQPTIYWPANAIAVRPLFGDPLSPATTYAAVVTRAVTPAAGGSYDRDRDFEDLLDGRGDATVGAARSMYEAALDALAEAGIPRDEVLSMAVFTTQDPTEELFGARDWMMSSYPEPGAVTERWRWVRDEGSYTLVTGAYGPAPIFQSGAAPYEADGSGEIVFEGGAPVVQGQFDARFALTVPDGDVPPEGWPIVLYAHGTGGDYQTFVRNGVAGQMASVGCAVLGIDQVLHGDRNPTTDSPDYLFFNFLNPLAARDNNRQSALDVVQQARFAASVEVPTRTLNTGGAPVHFDPTQIYVFGHSQGGLNMPLFMAADDQARGGILSGAGGTLLVSVIEKTEPISILAAVRLFLGLPGGTTEAAIESEHFVYEHPVLSLLQTWVDVADGVNYMPYLFDAPRSGFSPKSVMQVQGQTDPYNTPNAGHTLAAAARMPIVEPVITPIEALEIHGVEPVPAPVRGNVADGAATAGLIQVPDAGHFAVFEIPALQARARQFMGSFVDGVPTIP